MIGIVETKSLNVAANRIKEHIALSLKNTCFAFIFCSPLTHSPQFQRRLREVLIITK